MLRVLFKNMIYFFWFPALCLVAGCSIQDAPPQEKGDWKSMIRADHPRLFFNRETWPAVKARALNEEAQLFEEIKARLDELAGEEIESRDYGTRAAEAAFVFLVTEEEKYLDLANRLLSQSLDYYHRCFAELRSVCCFSFSRITVWAAYDWLFNHLS